MKDLEAKIKRLEEKNKLLTDNLFDAIWVIDIATMTFTYATPSIERLSGYSANEYIGLRLRERMSKKAYEEIVDLLNQSLLQLEKGIDPVKTIEVEMIHKNGALYWIEITCRLIKENDRPLKIVGISRDITQRKKYEFGQAELIERLNESLVEKQKLLSENKILRKLIPVCSGCKRVRDEENRWWPFDIYVERHTNTSMTHTICPDCRHVFYKDL
jgi:PAS domain S-box-containing protein